MDNIGFVVDERLAIVGEIKIKRGVLNEKFKNYNNVEIELDTSESPTIVTVPVFGCGTVESTDDAEPQPGLVFPSSPYPGGTAGYSSCVEVRLSTDHGELLVAIQGNRLKPAILTYHDVCLNYTTLLTFFNFHDMRIIRDNFCFYHINAPGQENGALSLPKNYVYPTMDQLANQINFVLGHFGIQEFIGFGIGAGANILARFALAYPQKVNALVLVNCTSTQAGWLEWGSQKMNVRALRSRGMTQKLVDYFLWELLGSDNSNRFPDSAVKYRSFLSQSLNPHNLAMFIESYTRRSDLGISRDAISLNVPVLNMTGAHSHRVDDTVTFNGRLYPNTTSWMKISDCSLIFEEQPAKLAEAFRLFLQGEGFVPPLSPTKIAAYHELLKNEYPKTNPIARRRRTKTLCRHTIIRITENPISEAVAC